MPRADGPFEVLKRINDNAYKVDLLGDYGFLAMYNVADLSPYQADDYLTNLRIKSFQQGDDDGVPSSQNNTKGPISLAWSNASSKVPVMSHILEKSHGCASRLNGQKMPSFDHLIS